MVARGKVLEVLGRKDAETKGFAGDNPRDRQGFFCPTPRSV